MRNNTNGFNDKVDSSIAAHEKAILLAYISDLRNGPDADTPITPEMRKDYKEWKHKELHRMIALDILYRPNKEKTEKFLAEVKANVARINAEKPTNSPSTMSEKTYLAIRAQELMRSAHESIAYEQDRAKKLAKAKKLSENINSL